MITVKDVDTNEARAERQAVRAGRLPARYAEPWGRAFLARVEPELVPGVRILDVGSGARPTIPVDQRPTGCHYVGLDVSSHELERSPRGSYDEIIAGDICAGLPRLTQHFELVISWQVLEHVRSLPAALATLSASLVPGGRCVAQLSGAWSIYACAGRVMPHAARTFLMQRLLDTDPEDRFPTRYDNCSDRALRRILPQWFSTFDVVPRYKAGGYLRFSPLLQRAYMTYEDWIECHAKTNLATHYIVDARR